MRSPFVVASAFAVLMTVSGQAAPRITAWVPAWDRTALDTMRVQAGKLDEANPGWYTMAADGTIAKNWNAEDENLRAALSGTALVPTIKNIINDRFDGVALAAIIRSPASRTAHVNAIADLVVQRGYSGIDIDYEKVPTTSRADFTTFIQELSRELHEQRALLSVTVHAKTGERDNWNGPGGQDWVAIGQAADYVKIMAYDYSWSTSVAGPIAPLDWLDRVATYAEQTIGGGKVIIGLPWYGYDWLGTDGDSVTYAQAIETARGAGATIERDANGEATYRYNGRTVFFQDAASYRTKVESLLARHSGIAGFAHWRVGAEDPRIWDVISDMKGQTSGSTPVRPAGDFAVAASTSAVQLKAGESASVAVWMTPIDGFAERVSATARTVGFAGPATLSRSSLAPQEQATLTISAPAGAAAGSYQAIVTLASATLVRELAIQVRVVPPPPPADFSLAGGSVTIVPGSSGTVRISLVPFNGFDGAARMSARSVDGFRGAIAFSSPVVSGSSPVTVAITPDARLGPGTYLVEIAASFENLVRTTLVEVTVPKMPRRRATSH